MEETIGRYDFSDKVVLVTGATSGIGAQTARMFAENGARVAVSGRSVERGEGVVGQITDDGGEAIFIQANVVNPTDVRQLVERVVSHFGALHFAFNNAGIVGNPGPLHLLEDDDYLTIIRTNLNSVFYSMKYELAHMISHGGGSIVNCSSFAGLNAVPGMSAYTASKHGVVGMTKAAALEYASANVRINAICPGGVLTPLVEQLGQQLQQAGQPMDETPAIGMGRMGRPEEVGELALWLCSDAASFVTGAAVAIDGGMNAG